MQHLINIIKKHAGEAGSNDTTFALRGHWSANVNIGDVLKRSLDYFNDDVEEYPKLSGTCAVRVTAARYVDEMSDDELLSALDTAYGLLTGYGDTVLLVVGDDTQEIGDDGTYEVILRDCTVIAKI